MAVVPRHYESPREMGAGTECVEGKNRGMDRVGTGALAHPGRPQDG